MVSEIDFALSDNPGIVQDVEGVSKILSSDHRLVTCTLRLNLKGERRKLVKTKKPPMESVRGGSQVFKKTLQNKSALLDERNKTSVKRLKDNLTLEISESAAAGGEPTCRQ